MRGCCKAVKGLTRIRCREVLIGVPLIRMELGQAVRSTGW